MTAVTKRLIELDDALLERARSALGTSGVTDTVRAALEQATCAAARAEEIDWLASGGMRELADRRTRDDTWRSSREP